MFARTYASNAIISNARVSNPIMRTVLRKFRAYKQTSLGSSSTAKDRKKVVAALFKLVEDHFQVSNNGMTMCVMFYLGSPVSLTGVSTDGSAASDQTPSRFHPRALYRGAISGQLAWLVITSYTTTLQDIRSSYVTQSNCRERVQHISHETCSGRSTARQLGS
jgi:hypothetical protein